MTTITRLDTARPQPDPLTAALMAALRVVVREELEQALARLQPAGHRDPPTLSVRQTAAATGMGEEAIRRVLAHNPT